MKQKKKSHDYKNTHSSKWCRVCWQWPNHAVSSDQSPNSLNHLCSVRSNTATVGLFHDPLLFVTLAQFTVKANGGWKIFLVAADVDQFRRHRKAIIVCLSSHTCSLWWCSNNAAELSGPTATSLRWCWRSLFGTFSCSLSRMALKQKQLFQEPSCHLCSWVVKVGVMWLQSKMEAKWIIIQTKLTLVYFSCFILLKSSSSWPRLFESGLSLNKVWEYFRKDQVLE